VASVQYRPCLNHLWSMTQQISPALDTGRDKG
jgi:hypothetical protein